MKTGSDNVAPKTPKSFHPKDEQYVIISAPTKKQFPRTYEARLRDDTPPQCSNSTHNDSKIVKGRLKKFERWDIVGGKPTKVILYVREWICRSTNASHVFLDPRSPFSGKAKTTTAFDRFLMKELIKNPDLTQLDLAARYSLSVTMINQLLAALLAEFEDLSYETIPCEELWLIPCTYRGHKHLLVCGIADKREGVFFEGSVPYGPILLGISDSFSFNSALSTCRIPKIEELERILCPDKLLNEARQDPRISKETLLVDLFTVPLPVEPFLLEKVLQHFHLQGYSFERAKAMLLLRNGYTKTHVTYRKENQWIFYSKSPTKFTSAPCQKRKNSHIKYSYYIDIEKLLNDYS